MKYIKLYENIIIFKKYGIEEVSGTYRIWEFINVREKNERMKNMILMKKIYQYVDGSLMTVQQAPFIITKEIALEGIIHQSDDLQELLDYFDAIITAQKYNL